MRRNHSGSALYSAPGKGELVGLGEAAWFPIPDLLAKEEEGHQEAVALHDYSRLPVSREKA